MLKKTLMAQYTSVQVYIITIKTLSWSKVISLGVHPCLDGYNVRDETRNRAFHDGIIAQDNCLHHAVGLIILPGH